MPLPLVDQNRRRISVEAPGIGVEQRPIGGLVKVQVRCGTPGSCCRLADALRTLNRNRRKRRYKFIQFSINDANVIRWLHGFYATIYTS
jgi:hypothetical protein